MTIPPLGEFELIARLAARMAPPAQAGAVGIGDDCAALPQGQGFLLLTCDVAVANRHFIPGRTPMADVGWRVATAGASDVAACGGKPTWALVSLGVPDVLAVETLDALYDGLAQAAEAYGFQVVGGNVSGASELIVDLFMLGETPRFIPRGGARPGDLIAVSGVLGGSEAGRLALEEDKGGAEALISRHLRPLARLDLVPLLQEAAGAAIDISDGLASELGHLAGQSGVRIEVARDRVPVPETLPAWAAARGLDVGRLAFESGEEFQLLFTLPPHKRHLLEGADVTVIGEVREGQGVFVDGQPLTVRGWDHLRTTP